MITPLLKPSHKRKECKECGVEFIGDSRRKFCTLPCSTMNQRKKHGMISPYPDLSRGTVGAISELRACSHLMGMGCETFRCLSPNSHADLVIIVGRTCFRVAVKTAHKSTLTGRVNHAPERHDFDILALVYPGGIDYLITNGEKIKPSVLK